MTTPPAEPPTPPLTDDDRESAVRRLRDAYAAGHVPHEEMDERLGRALTARTPADLATAVASLPAEPAAPEEPAVTIAAATGRIRRGGAWRLPRRLKVESAFGKVRLDLSRAVFPHPVLDLELALGTGSARITVPRDAVVEVGGLTTTWKDLRYRPRPTTSPTAPTIRLSGVVGFGRVKIRHARR
ncbi:DUF1707 domain-containing protein [Streptomyces sp. NPDC020983]|uniref:DUF1707 domain-containing protein n=1 Tax=Streptomyces sp. NPDC020983 TaxID=3365106 RepID=UPI0037B958D3